MPINSRYIGSVAVFLMIINIHVDIAEIVVEFERRRQLVKVRIVIQECVQAFQAGSGPCNVNWQETIVCD